MVAMLRLCESIDDLEVAVEVDDFSVRRMNG